MKAFIFDFDGVIVDSERYWRELDETFFPGIAPGYTMDHAAQMMGLGRKAGYEFLVQTLGMTMTFETYVTVLDEEVAKIYGDKTALLPGLPELLVRLQKSGYNIGLASSSQQKWVEQGLVRLGIREAFQAISTADDVNHKTKPAPDLYLHAAAALGVSPEDCTALEDSKNGITSAKAAGMTCFAIRTDMNPEQDLSQADEVYESLHNIQLV
jgi:HAD superfamily hydrolase (TIGR01509 family)